MKNIFFAILIMNWVGIFLFYDYFHHPKNRSPDNIFLVDLDKRWQNYPETYGDRSDPADLVDMSYVYNQTKSAISNFVGDADGSDGGSAAHSDDPIIDETSNNTLKQVHYSQADGSGDQTSDLSQNPDNIIVNATELHSSQSITETPFSGSQADMTFMEQNNLIDELESKVGELEAFLLTLNPLEILEAYPELELKYLNTVPHGDFLYDDPYFGIIHDEMYCPKVDTKNLNFPRDMMKAMNFFTDYSTTSILRSEVIRTKGDEPMKDSYTNMWKHFFSPVAKLSSRINMFYLKRTLFHFHHNIGSHFLCVTQMYNHIPGHGVLIRRDKLLNNILDYSESYINKTQCFNSSLSMIIPTFRLYIEEECLNFFNLIRSQDFIDKQKSGNLQYLVKKGYGAHKGKGVYLFDENEESKLNQKYSFGSLCGRSKKSILVQKYISNPLLLERENKFDFRFYLLIASTNPMIAYVHDGFLRNSKRKYEKNSKEILSHLIDFDWPEPVNSSNMTEVEKADAEYQMMSLEELEAYLFKIGKIPQPKWVKNHLKPKINKLLAHFVKMSENYLWKESNVFEFLSADFMIDDDLNIWFLEMNESPPLASSSEVRRNQLTQMMSDMFDIQYSYYRSRMSRLIKLIEDMKKEVYENPLIDYGVWKAKYKEIIKNKLEEKFSINSNNTFKLLVDKTLTGENAYSYHIEKECLE